MKKLVVIILVMSIVVMMVGCSTDETPAANEEVVSEVVESEEVSEEATSEEATEEAKVEEPKEAYFVGIMSGGPAWGQAQKGFEEACAELGWEGYYLAPATPNDTVEMAGYIETAITHEADAIVGLMYSSDIFGDSILRARENGTLIATTNCFLTEEYEDFWIGTAPDGMGRAQAEALVNIAGGEEITVVYMQTKLDTETQNSQFEVFNEYLQDYDNITVYGQEECNSDPIVAADKISALVKANSKINACVTADSFASLGVANYVDEQGLQDSFYSIGIDDSAEILNYVDRGALDCTIAQDFYAMGYQSVMMFKEIMDGNTVEFANDSGSVVIYPADTEAYATEKGIER